MPSVSSAQHRAMESAARGHSTLGIPENVGKEFVAADSASRGDCAGILFRARGPLYLLLQRADTGEWAQPGGHLEDGETPEEAAVRECVEEIGGCPEGLRWAVRRNSIPKGKGVFTCYLQDVDRPFEPQLNDEHTNWGWFAPDQLPSPIHRKVAETIARVDGNELDIAKRMAAGELLSPQRYHSVWLFKLRITGTGTSYRSKIDEYVYRPPENFLTDEFVQRCNGLPLIFEHPEERVTLNTEEYRNRAIGTVVLPFIEGDEVNGIAKVFDDDAASLMRTSHASTSPAVVFRDAGSTETVQLDDGSTVLIEGNPSYLDHLAICEEGVWDKGGEPTGVNIEGDSAVDNEIEEKVPAWADALGKGFKDACDSIHARLDSLEKGRKDGDGNAEEAGRVEETDEHKAAAALKAAEEAGHKEKEDEERKDAEEKARKDSEEAAKKEEEEKKRKDSEETEFADAAKRDAATQLKIKALEGQIAELTKPRSNADRDELSRVQMRAENAAMAFGDSNLVSPPMFDESPIAYRKRCASIFQKHSAKAKGINLKALDAASFAIIEEGIYADAQAASNMPAALPKGRLHATTDRSTGHTVTTYKGDPEVTWAPFKHRGFSARINKDVGKRVN